MRELRQTARRWIRGVFSRTSQVASTRSSFVCLHSCAVAGDGTRARWAQTTAPMTVTATSTVGPVTSSPRNHADQTRVRSVCSCCTCPPRAMPASDSPLYQAKKPRYIDETPSRTRHVHSDAVGWYESCVYHQSSTVNG